MVTQTSEPKKWFSAIEVAKELEVSPKTVYGWWDSGKMESWRMGGPGGQRRTTREAIDKFMKPCVATPAVRLTPEQERLEAAMGRLLTEFGLK
jgi:excisionase family DNA binding protein